MVSAKISRLSIDYWVSVNGGFDQVSIECRSRVSIKCSDRHSTADAFSTHDPRYLKTPSSPPQPPRSSSCFYWTEIRDMNQFELLTCHNFLFLSLGWFGTNSFYICSWPFDKCIGESTWLPLNCNHRCIIVCQWPLTLISCFKYLHHVHNLQCFVWIW